LRDRHGREPLREPIRLVCYLPERRDRLSQPVRPGRV